MMILQDKWIIVEGLSVDEDDINQIKAQLQELPENKRDKVRILVSRDMSIGDSDVFETLCSNFPNTDVHIKVDDVEYDPNFNMSQVFTRDEMVKLFENNSVIEKNGGKLFLSAYTYGDDPLDRENKIPFSKVIQSNARMNNWVDKINKARVNGKPLSPFEKYLYAYQIVTQFKYTGEQIFEARDISRVLSSKFIVCAGYSSILSELCRRVGIVCKRQGIHANDTGNAERDVPGSVNHEECILYLKDTKYGIDGFFITDPTQDSFDMYVEDGSTICYSLICIDEHDRLYKNQEQIMITDFSNFSNYFFLRDAGVIPPYKLFYESPTYIEDVISAIDGGVFDKGFSTYIKYVLDNVTVPEKVDEIVSFNGEDFANIAINGQCYSVEDISKNTELMTNLAYKCFSTSNIPNDPDSIVIKQFFEKAVAKYLKDNGTELSSELSGELVSKFIETAKETDAVACDPELLSSIADFYDYNVVIGTQSYEKLHEIFNTHPTKTPTLEDFRKAMRVVYIASGETKENARKMAKKIISTSVWLADAEGWASAGTQNPFALEAQRTKPFETVQRKQIEEIEPYLEQIGVSMEEVLQILADRNEDEFMRIMDEVEKVIPKDADVTVEIIDESKPTKKIDNKTIKTWGSSKSPKFWKDPYAEQIEVIESSVFND